MQELTGEQSTFLSSHNPGWIEKDWLVRCINYLISTIDDVDTRRKLERMRSEILRR